MGRLTTASFDGCCHCIAIDLFCAFNPLAPITAPKPPLAAARLGFPSGLVCRPYPAGLARPALDYEFFTLFTERIEGSDAEDRKELVEKRNLLLKITEEIDKQLDKRVSEIKNQIDLILEKESIEEAIVNNIGAIDQLFLQVASSELKDAQENGDEAREEKISKLLQVIQKLTTPPELEVIEALLRVSEDGEKTKQLINELDEQLLQRVIDYLTSIISRYDDQIDSGTPADQTELIDTQEKLKFMFNEMLRKSMQLKMGQ